MEFSEEEAARILDLFRGEELDYFKVMEWCAEKGHLGSVKWLYEMGVEINKNIMYYACGGGQLSVVKWLRSQGCEWHSYSIWVAFLFNHHNVAGWLRDNGCPS